MHRYDRVSALYDVYIDEEGDLLLAGKFRVADPRGGYVRTFWIVKADSRTGDIIWSRTYPEEGELPDNVAVAKTIVQTDDGCYVFGGRFSNTSGSSGLFTIYKISGDGDEIWRRQIGMEETYLGEARAIIELKSGDLLAGGGTNFQPLAAHLTQEGEIVWIHQYEAPQYSIFVGMREAEDGYLMCMFLPRSRTRLLKVNDDGDIIWQREYDEGWPSSSIRCRDGGLATCGNSDNRFVLTYYDDNGERVWSNTYNSGIAAMSLCQDQNDGFVLVGNSLPGNPAVIQRTDRAGNDVWHRTDINEDDATNEYNSMVTQNGIDIYMVGTSGSYGTLIKLFFDRLDPVILCYYPDSLELVVLTGSEVEFWIEAEDSQGDELIYLWTLNGEPSGEDTSLSVVFDIGGTLYNVACVVSDGVYSDSIDWRVSVRNLFIFSHSPDTLDLSLRRGTSVDFPSTPSPRWRRRRKLGINGR